MGKMMKYLFFLIAGLSLCACAPMNTEFSCHSTAGDRCLSIEAVNTMTEVGDDAVQQMHNPIAHVTSAYLPSMESKLDRVQHDIVIHMQ